MTRFSARRRLAALLLALGAAAPAHAAHAAAPFTGGLKIILFSALFSGEKPQPGDPNLLLDMEAENGQWGRAFGMALNFNQGDHYGFVRSASVSDTKIHAKVLLTIARDNWVSGGDAAYDITLTRTDKGLWEGTYEGSFKNQKISGKASGEIKPPRPMLDKDLKPLDPAEHPRLLFRKADVPALKERLKTPLGQAFLEKARAATKDPVSLGMLYQLTGEKQYADAARKLIESYQGDLSPEGGGGTGGIGHRLVAITLCYDLCCDAWDPLFRKELNENLYNTVSYMQRSLSVAGANFSPCSNYYGPGRGAPAIASLALYGDKGPAPKKPVSPDEIASKGGLEAKLMARNGKLDEYKNQYEKLLAKWTTESAEYQAAGGADLGRLETFYAGFIQMNRHYRLGVGDGGFQAETGGYADIAVFYPLLYASCYRTMFGRNPSAYPDISHLVPRRLMQVYFPADEQPRRGKAGRVAGSQVVVKINSAVGFRPDHAAAAWPIVPDAYKPAVLWAWNHVAGAPNDTPLDAESAARLLPDPGETGQHLANAFLHYPLDMKPVHPSKVMPNTWEARSLGFYLFRSGWEGKDEFIGQSFLKAQPIGGWNHPNAGTFRLFGLGHAWATGCDVRQGYREQENVVLLPNDKINQGSCARLTQLAHTADGSGSLTMDLGDLYGTTRTAPVVKKVNPKTKAGGIAVGKAEDEVVDRRLPLYDANGIRMPENWADSTISGLRAMAFDYSGKSGAPCLFVLADKVAGGKDKVWIWQVPHDGDAKAGRAVEPKVKVAGNTFTFDYGDAFLKGTLISPRDAKLEETREEAVFGDTSTKHSFEGQLHRIKATASSGEFLVVATVQRKDAPAVKVEGQGLSSQVTVGGQRISFDGQKIQLGP